MTEPAAEQSEATSAPTSESATEHGRIVVGVDGSDPSLHALRWADRQAVLTGATLEAVTAWEMPASFGWGGAVPGLPEDYDLGASAAQALREAIEQALPPARAAEVSPVTVMGNPAQVLLDRGEGAELIVVGVRGRGTFRATLLGSVSHTVTLHAACPVVVVRGEAQQAD
ncbi:MULTISPECIES: universal stress protein [Streptomycetaceae]|jgi:nucleotide-binding universal stress UspA family protein|uniref:universal stress protein n=1 Tax=Streptomycetaceae TaxID=2062 RepID=UPI003008F4C2